MKGKWCWRIAIGGILTVACFTGTSQEDWRTFGEFCVRLHRSLEEITDDPHRATLIYLRRLDPDQEPSQGYVSPKSIRLLMAGFVYSILAGSVVVGFDLWNRFCKGWSNLCSGPGSGKQHSLTPEERRWDQWINRGYSSAGAAMLLCLAGQYVLTYGDRWTFGAHGLPVPVLAADAEHYTDGHPLDPFVRMSVKAGTIELWGALFLGGLGCYLLVIILDDCRCVDVFNRQVLIARLDLEIKRLNSAGESGAVNILRRVRREHQAFIDQVAKFGWFRWVVGGPRIVTRIPLDRPGSVLEL